ncbi:MAG: cytochrome c oxidase subunit II [Flavobacteriaceae bacterium]|nr:cytochrome c oxidase subunit II [Flavobacteriaceae bacterium]
MQALFYIFVAIAIGVGFWQIAKLSNLKQVVATEKDNDLQGKLFLGFLVAFYAMMAYCLIALDAVTLPESASVEGEHYDNLYMITFVLIGIVQFFIQFLIFFFTFKYRGINNRKALYYADSHTLEIVWTVIPTIVLTALIGYGLWAWNNIMDLSDAEDPLYIEVYGKQFSWEARYAGADGSLGDANVRFIKGKNTMGVDMTDPTSADDIHVRELHLPKGQKVIFKFRSQDVMHSAYMPHFRAQMNCVPGMVTQFGFTPKLTTAEMRLNPKTMAKVANINKIRKEKGEDDYIFDYLLLCNKICGSSHYNMQMKIVVDEPADYLVWLATQKTLAQELN